MIPRFWRRFPESWMPTLFRYGLNWFPAYRATGARIVRVSPDLHEVVVRLPLSLRTRNGAGSLYGGSLYSATDPIYAVMLAYHLGPDYIVWDKSAAIRFRKPGRCAVEAVFSVSAAEIAQTRTEVGLSGACDRHFQTRFIDADGAVYAEIDKTVYVAAKDHYHGRRGAFDPPTRAP